MEKIELLVIHEENMKEDENPENYDKCKFYETKEHRRVLRSDFEILEQYGTITISTEEKESGVYAREEDEDKRKIPDNANALFVVGETKHFKRYVAQYCKLNENSVGEKKKKHSWFFPWGLLLPSVFTSRYNFF
jgi:S-adenosylmethionine hydrolase